MSFTQIANLIVEKLLTERRVGYDAELLVGRQAWDGRKILKSFRSSNAREDRSACSTTDCAPMPNETGDSLARSQDGPKRAR